MLNLQFTFSFKICISYYMAVSHKDWELPNSRIWLTEIDIDRGLDFPIETGNNRQLDQSCCNRCPQMYMK